MIHLIKKYYYCFLLERIRNSEFSPKKEQLQSFGPLFISNLALTDNFNEPISEDIASGVSKEPLEALIKSISEYVERISFRHGKMKGYSLCQTNRSEGFAAYPYLPFNKKKIIDIAREISVCESVERFSWPYFWLDKSIGYQIVDCKHPIQNCVFSLTGIESIQHIFPAVKSDKILCISIAKTGPQGAILGASCSKNRNRAITGSIHELIKHYIGLKKIDSYPSIQSNYIKRLHHLSKVGFSLYKERLSFKGTNTINLPRLEMDSLIPNPFDRYFVVYRTRFEGQMEFISESLNLGYI